MAGIEIPIDGLECEIKGETLIISRESPLKTLSSSIVGGGYKRPRYILNHHVERDFSHKQPEQYLKIVAKGLGIKERFVGMMTAAELKNHSITICDNRDLKVVSIVTGGISNAAAAGEPKIDRSLPGTINTIILVDGKLTSSAMAGAIITATEAKTAALRELGIRSVSNSEIATGTTTDSIVVACTEEGFRLKYAGTATTLGEFIGRTVKKATLQAIKCQEEI